MLTRQELERGAWSTLPGMDWLETGLAANRTIARAAVTAKQAQEPLIEGGVRTPLSGMLLPEEREGLEALNESASAAQGEAQALQSAVQCVAQGAG